MDLFTETIPPCRISLAAQESTDQNSPFFPQYRNDVDFTPATLVGELIRECNNIRETAFKKWVPNPVLVPLLKGNVGEYLLIRC